MADPNDLSEKSPSKPPEARDARTDAAFNSIEFGAPPSPETPSGGVSQVGSAKKRGGRPRGTKPEGEKPEEKRKTSILGSRAGPIPDSVAERFIQIGNNFFFPDGTEAFTDQGNRVTTRSENTVVIQSMVAIAQVRAQDEVTVQGTDFFRREAWFAAKLVGLEVRGYEPTPLEHERLVRAVARRQAAEKGTEAPADPDAKSRSAGQAPRAFNEGELIVGRLVDHGPARYHHKSNEPMSYYVRIETDLGDREIWGVDLERAFRHSLSAPGVGDEIGLRAAGRTPISVPAVKRGADGREIGREEIQTHRNQWIIERKEFLDHRREMADTLRDPQVSASDAVKRYPELEGSYLAIEVARLGAEERIGQAPLREQFVTHLREYLARTVEYGQPLEPVPPKAREQKAHEPEKLRDRDHAPTR